MASASNSTTLYSSAGYGYTLTASFNENSTSTANNTSNITCTATFSASNSNWYTSYASTLTIYWHDNRENYDRQVASINFSGIDQYSSKTASGTINVTHNTDGSLSGYAYAYFTKGSTTTSWACNSGGVTTNWTALTTIPRASQPSINSYPTNSPNFNIGDTITIHMNRKSNVFTHSVYFNYGSTSVEVATGVVDNCTFDTSTIANALYQLIPNAKYYSKTISVKTYNGSTLIGTKTCNYNAYVTNSNPTIGSASYQDVNSSVLAVTGDNQDIVRNKSSIMFLVENLQAQNYATLSSCKVTLNNVTSTFSGISGTSVSNADVLYGSVNLSSDAEATITLTDSRGFVTTTQINVNILNYENPYSTITCQRQSNFYTETYLEVDCTFSSLNNRNQITIEYQTKKASDTNYGSLTTINNNTEYTIQLDNNYQWNVRVVTTDSIGTIVSYVLFVDRGIPLIYFDRLLNSVGINCFPTSEESLEVNEENILKRIEGFGEVCQSASTNDWNTACGTASGFYMGSDMSNSPSGETVSNWWIVIHLAHNNLYQRQIAFSFLNNNQIFTRIKNNGTWNSWNLIGSGTTKTDLWVNSNPNTALASTNITLPTDDYDYLEIYYYDWSGDTGSYKDLMCQKVIKGYGTKLTMQLKYNSYTYAGNRRIRHIDNTTLAIDDCHATIDNNAFTNNVRNTWCVPVKIVGIKEYL